MFRSERTCRLCGFSCTCVAVKVCSACISQTPGGDSTHLTQCACMERVGLTSRGAQLVIRVKVGGVPVFEKTVADCRAMLPQLLGPNWPTYTGQNVR